MSSLQDERNLLLGRCRASTTRGSGRGLHHSSNNNNKSYKRRQAGIQLLVGSFIYTMYSVASFNGLRVCFVLFVLIEVFERREEGKEKLITKRV